MYIYSMKRNISGIYIIKNTVNNKVYIRVVTSQESKLIY
jgi:hypothetical protein